VNEISLQIEDLSHDARGIARHEGKVVFVPGALPGERVQARLKHRGKQTDDYELISITEASKDRVQPRCAHFDTCSGCSLQHLAPEAQLRFKQEQLADAFARLGQVTPGQWLPGLAADAWGYRRKARLSARYVEKKGRMLVGFRDSNPRFVADLTRCETLDARLGARLETLARHIEGLNARREIPQIEVAFGDADGALVIRHMQALGESDRAKLCALGAEFELSIYLQANRPDALELLYQHAAELHYSLPDENVSIRFRPLDFTQVNASLNRLMVAQAMRLLAPQPGEQVLDLYCGLGNFTLPIARRGARVTGVEGDPGLVARARANALHEGLGEQVDYHVADLSQPVAEAGWSKQAYHKVLLDPPRAGADVLLQSLSLQGVQCLVYVSCHPGTLARDAGILVRQHGFVLESAGVMDMFPHTNHVESMAVFKRPS